MLKPGIHLTQTEHVSMQSGYLPWRPQLPYSGNIPMCSPISS